MIKTILFNILWEISVFYFRWIPRSICKRIHKCSIDCQLQKAKDSSLIVYAVKIHPKKGRIEDHFMNWKGGDLYDINGNRAKWNGKLGSRIDFGNGPYAVIAIAENWSDFGWASLAHMMKDTHELNKYLDRTRR